MGVGSWFYCGASALAASFSPAIAGARQSLGIGSNPVSTDLHLKFCVWWFQSWFNGHGVELLKGYEQSQGRPRSEDGIRMAWRNPIGTGTPKAYNKVHDSIHLAPWSNALSVLGKYPAAFRETSSSFNRSFRCDAARLRGVRVCAEFVCRCRPQFVRAGP